VLLENEAAVGAGPLDKRSRGTTRRARQLALFVWLDLAQAFDGPLSLNHVNPVAIEKLHHVASVVLLNQEVNLGASTLA